MFSSKFSLHQVKLEKQQELLTDTQQVLAAAQTEVHNLKMQLDNATREKVNHLTCNMLLSNQSWIFSIVICFTIRIVHETKSFKFQESLRVEMGLLEARLENSKRKLESDLRSDFERQVS